MGARGCRKKPKKSRKNQQKATRPTKKKSAFDCGAQACTQQGTQTLRVSNIFVHLHMGIEIHNRLKVGFALGWSYYSRDREFDYSEITIYLGLISIKIMY